MKNSFLFVPVIISFLLFICLAITAYSNPYFPIDLLITSKLQETTNIFYRQFMILISFPGYGIYKYLILIAVSLILLYLKKYKEVEGLLFAALGAELIGLIAKVLVARPRPSPDLISYIYQIEKSTSFPSGHVVYYVGFFGFILFLSLKIQNKIIRNIIIIICSIFLIMVGFSRVYLGAHWFTDVTGGYLLGFSWLFLSIIIYNLIIKKKNESR